MAPPWAWATVGTALIISTIQDGTTFSTAFVLYPDFIEAFESTTAAVGVLPMVLNIMVAVSGLLVGLVVDRMSYSTLHAFFTLVGATGLAISALSTNIIILHITFGIVAGLGFGSCLFIRAVCIQRYFDKNRALAMGLVVIGYGCSNVFFGVLVRVLTNIFGWRGALLLCAGLFLQCLPFNAAFRPLPAPKTPAGYRREDKQVDETTMDLKGILPLKESQETTPNRCKRTSETNWACGVIQQSLSEYAIIVRNVRFDLLTMGTMLVNVGITTLMFHTANRAVQSGIDKMKASLLLTVVGGASVLGRLLFSVVANSERVSTVLCYGLAALLGGVVTAAMYWTHTFAELAVASALGGLFSGGFYALQTTTVRDITGLDSFAKAYSLFLFLATVTSSLASPYSGWLYDVTGRYDLTYMINGCAQILGWLLILICDVMTCRPQPTHGRPTTPARDQQTSSFSFGECELEKKTTV